MKLIVDENIPFGKEAFENFGKVELCNGREINASICKNADALIVRSITKVNEALLGDSAVKFVGTSTIGTDHIDQAYLKKRNVTFSSAAGCNSYSVAEYVFSALTYLANKHKLTLNKLSIGVVGYGNIGKKVVAIAEALGMQVLVNDPPLERTRTSTRDFSTLDEALGCDVVTFHVPLNRGGEDNTLHLLNEENLKFIKANAIVINASRGAVMSNEAFKKRIEELRDIYAVLDVWETEPDYDTELLKLVEIGTPHIAGYSYEGKVNGTVMIYDALSKHLGLHPDWKPKLPPVNPNQIESSGRESAEELLTKLFRQSYSIIKDDTLMREGMNLPTHKRTEHFDTLRKQYKIRRELSNFKVLSGSGIEKFENLLKTLRVFFDTCPKTSD